MNLQIRVVAGLYRCVHVATATLHQLLFSRSTFYFVRNFWKKQKKIQQYFIHWLNNFAKVRFSKKMTEGAAENNLY